MTLTAAFPARFDVGASRWTAGRVLILVGLALGLAAASALAVRYAQAGNLTVLWPTNALAVAALLRGPQERGWRTGVAIAHVCAVVGVVALAGAPLWICVWLGVGNAFEAVASFVLLQRIGVGDPNRDPVRSTLLFVPVVGLVCAFTALACLWPGTQLGAEPPLSVLFSFWWQDLFGMGMIVPLAMSLTRERMAFLKSKRELTLFVASLVIIAALAFAAGLYPGSPLSALVLPAQIFAAIRFGMLGATSVTLTTALFALSTLVLRHDGGDEAAFGAAVLQMELRLAVVFVSLMAVSSVIRQRDAFQAELQRRRADAEAANLEKSRLVRDLSHEMRTPLNAVVGFSDILLRGIAGPLPDQQRELISTVNDAARQLHTLADDMIDIAGAETGSIELTVSTFDVGPQVEATLRALAPVICAASAEVRLHPPSPVANVRADAARVDEILQRLITNAVEHAGACGPIEVSVYVQSADRVRIYVRDHGPGIPHNAGGALFQPFNRFAKDAGRYGNKGVGLALARRFAELQGGSVGYENPPDGGARFWLELAAA